VKQNCGAVLNTRENYEALYIITTHLKDNRAPKEVGREVRCSLTIGTIAIKLQVQSAKMLTRDCIAVGDANELSVS